MTNFCKVMKKFTHRLETSPTRLLEHCRKRKPQPPPAMSHKIDLNRLRDIVHSNQAVGNTDPRSPRETIVVDRNASIRTGDSLHPGEAGHVSKIQQDTFHSGLLEIERQTAIQRMPANTRMVVSKEGIRGWLYSFPTEFLETYTMFAYFDGSYYQVLVISPYVEDKFRSPHSAHLYRDGRICMGVGMNSGRSTLADAYAKSVLWANGFSAMIQLGLDRFPFNHND